MTQLAPSAGIERFLGKHKIQVTRKIWKLFRYDEDVANRWEIDFYPSNSIDNLWSENFIVHPKHLIVGREEPMLEEMSGLTFNEMASLWSGGYVNLCKTHLQVGRTVVQQLQHVFDILGILDDKVQFHIKLAADQL